MKDLNKQYESILDRKHELNAIKRIVHLNSRANTCNNCETRYYNLKTYYYQGEELCPVCDADIIDRYKARKQGYKAA